MDQSFKYYMGVKLIQAYPAPKSTPDGDVEGYIVKYPDGYESWSPKDAFEAAYLQLDVNHAVTPAVINSMIASVEVSRVDPKTTLLRAETVTGFVEYATSSCVTPENYNEELGQKYAGKKIEDKLWFAMGFVLQWAKFGLKNTPRTVQGGQS